MRKEALAAGIILAIIGISIFIAGSIQIPYTTTEFVEVPHSDVMLDEALSVPALTHVYRTTTFYNPLTLHIAFTVTAGGDKDIDFEVMDEVNYWKMRAGETYEIYAVPSRSRVTSLDMDWHPPTDEKLYFVWDNSFSLITSKSVSAYFDYTYTEIEQQEVTKYRQLFSNEMPYYLAFLLIISATALAGYGLVAKPSQSKQPIISSPS